MAKKSLLRHIGSPNPKLELASLEEDLLKAVNRMASGRGAGRRGDCHGRARGEHPCHIASLPVAVNINCHAARHKTITL